MNISPANSHNKPRGNVATLVAAIENRNPEQPRDPLTSDSSHGKEPSESTVAARVAAIEDSQNLEKARKSLTSYWSHEGTKPSEIKGRKEVEEAILPLLVEASHGLQGKLDLRHCDPEAVRTLPADVIKALASRVDELLLKGKPPHWMEDLSNLTDLTVCQPGKSLDLKKLNSLKQLNCIDASNLRTVRVQKEVRVDLGNRTSADSGKQTKCAEIKRYDKNGKPLISHAGPIRRAMWNDGNTVKKDKGKGKEVLMKEPLNIAASTSSSSAWNVLPEGSQVIPADVIEPDRTNPSGSTQEFPPVEILHIIAPIKSGSPDKETTAGSRQNSKEFSHKKNLEQFEKSLAQILQNLDPVTLRGVSIYCRFPRRMEDWTDGQRVDSWIHFPGSLQTG